MTTNVVVFGFGAILILVAILGGGFELKEFKVPKVGWAPRFLAGIAGLIFVMWGAGMSTTSLPEGTSEVKAAPKIDAQEAGAPIEFTIYDNLGQEAGRVSEQITVLLDGKIRGQLTADIQNPGAMLTITVPRPGRYSYMLDATRVVNYRGVAYRYAGAGQGTINVEDNKKFDLVETISGNTWLVSIMDSSELQKTR